MKNFSDSRFMRLLHQPTMVVSLVEIETAFEEFVHQVYQLFLSPEDKTQLFFALQHSHSVLIALQKMQLQSKEETNILNAYTASGVSFLEAAVTWVKEILGNKPLTIQSVENRRVMWTGSKIDLAEFIYGADTLKNFNNGEITLKEVADYLGKMLNVEIKDVSGCYTDMRERTSECRTTYLERMGEALNRRMECDDERLYKLRK